MLTGREKLHSGLRLCPTSKLDSEASIIGLRDWLASAWDYMAMGNFPYPSGYMLNGQGALPAFPVRVACSALSKPNQTVDNLLNGMITAAGVFYNYTGSLPCFDINGGPNPETTEVADFWGYQ
jgi:lysosomal Pro-X carboxypeptidase